MSAFTDPRLSLPARLKAALRAAATYDVFPAFSAKVRQFVYHPLGVLSLAATASLRCGLFLHTQGFVLCGGVLAVIALGVIWPWLSLRGLSGAVTFDRTRASEGASSFGPGRWTRMSRKSPKTCANGSKSCVTRSWPAT
jgi:hypothetical protein